MLSISNFYPLFYEHMKILYENARLMALHDVALQPSEVKELDVCGSLVLSNSVTYAFFLLVNPSPHCTKLQKPTGSVYVCSLIHLYIYCNSIKISFNNWLQ